MISARTRIPRATAWKAALGGLPAQDAHGERAAGRSRRGFGPRTLVRAAGSVLKIVVALWFLHTIGVVRPDSDTIGHAAVILVVLAILVGPWFVRLVRSLSFERAARIREQERAEVAAHLHDSVLQTLALIQTRSSDSIAVATLARRQERELRRWLFERPGARAGDSVKTALEVAAGEIEELHGVPIEVVIVGDGAVDARVDALVQAAREAMANAAKFAGSARVDLYAEVEPTRVEVFVRDRGVGFDPSAISPDRRGVRDSIFGRMQRHGGRAAVHSAPGEGTEVDLVMELASA
jgi:signal transduction histidine kinase